MPKPFHFPNSLKITFVLLLTAILLAFMLSSFTMPGIFSYSSTATESAEATPTAPVVTAEAYPSPQKLLQVTLPDNLSIPSVAAGKYFYVQNKDQWECTFLKGVNIGLTLPTTDLNDPDISYETYLQWFDMIGQMNVNTVKVFTIMNPDFYRALFYYNSKHTGDPLYLLHGLWFCEDDMYSVGDAFGENGKILTALQRSAREAIDIIHGNSDYTDYGSVSPAVYDRDISQYVVGWILGLEWDPAFIQTTNANHADKADYQGEYLTTGGATPFESFLCQAGDYAIRYETENYAAQRPVAFLSWQSTDLLTQEDEPFPEEDMVQVNTETILPTAAYYAGLFAAVDIYPYYPEFMNYQQEYLNYKDADGTVNTYRGYLNALKESYTVPVVVAEVGLSTSRGIAHNSVMGYNQGGLDETQQGQMLLKMIQDIAYESYAGAMIFSWQDEWFKQTWNTYKYYPAQANSRTPNQQSAEQHYGLLAYEPGATENACYPDGNLAEWADSAPVFSNSQVTLYIQYDEGYLYIMGKTSASFDLETDQLVLPLSTTGRGNLKSLKYGISFAQPTDFLLVLNGRKDSRLLVDAAYDYFYYEYAVSRKVFPCVTANEGHKTGIFNTIRMFTSNEIVLSDGQTIPAASYEAGALTYGNANPVSSDYSSLADFCFGKNSFEIRIPWYLINVLSPTEGLRMGDFYTGVKGVKAEEYGSFYIGAGNLTKNQTIKMSAFTVERWEQSTYHARLKKSYSILAEGLPAVMSNY